MEIEASFMENIEELRKSLTKPLDEVKARIMDLFRPIVTSHAEAIEILGGKIKTYKREQEEIRQQEEDRLREITRKENERQQKIAVVFQHSLPSLQLVRDPSQE